MRWMVAVLAICAVGCGTTYSPREPGWVHIVMANQGEEVLERDGKTYPIEIFSASVMGAVAGNPAAEDVMRTYVSRSRTAGGLGILSAVVSPIGLALLALSAGEPSTSRTEQAAHARTEFAIAGATTMLVGLAALVGAAIVAGTGEKYLYDAINVYNDGSARE
jgi:hypothetical protein